MIVSVAHGDRGKLVDANGDEIPYALWADTVTGDVIVYRRSGSQSVIQRDCAATERIRCKPPLRLIDASTDGQ